MTYADARDREQLRSFNPAIADYVARRTSNPNSDARRTLFLLPGGTGSKLKRATRAYDDSNPGQTFNYDTIWLNLGTFFGDALDLKMHRTAAGEFRDKGDRIIIAGGPVEILGCGPYNGFTQWCEDNDIDWFVFGYDWRRPLEEIRDFFIGKFLAHFRQQVTAAGPADPLQNFVIVGHSQGGMVVNLIADSADLLLNGMTHAITVAAPFYGYGGQLHRWFVGEPMLNHLGRRKVVQTITSFPGCYALNYFDQVTFSANQAALAADPFPLTAYPAKDHTTPAVIVDPYNAPPTRYPGGSGFDGQALGAGKLTVEQLAAAQTRHTAEFFCIRGVKSGGNSTTGSVRWKTVPGTYDIGGDPSPIVDGPQVPGDGTQPAWTTRLVTLAPRQVVTVQGRLDHADMMEFAGTQTAIGNILAGVTTMMLRHSGSLAEAPPEIATTDEAMVYVSALYQLWGKGTARERRRVDAFLESQPVGKCRAIARRVLADLMRGPTSDSKVTPAEMQAIAEDAARFVAGWLRGEPAVPAKTKNAAKPSPKPAQGKGKLQVTSGTAGKGKAAAKRKAASRGRSGRGR